MRKQIVAGNWKMNTTVSEGAKLINDIIALKNEVPTEVELIVNPPFTHIIPVAEAAKQTTIKVGAQNCSNHTKGAYTGEVSAEMLASIGASHVILGHSERREYFMEDSKMLLEKVKLTLANQLTPIFCCGERLDERESNQHFNVVKTQIEEVLFALSASDAKRVVIAYEPVWAIGTGKTASSEQAQEMHLFIRKTLAEKFGNDIAQSISILYGGSCKPSNAVELFSQPDVDGGLIGGASLVAEDFIAIAKSFPKSK